MKNKFANRDRILERLAKGPATRVRLEIDLSLGVTTIWRWIETLHKGGPQLVYISGWERTKDGEGQPTPVYSLGSKKDVPNRFKPMTDKEKAAKRRKMQRKDNSWEEKLARDRAKYWAKKAPPARDPLTAALYGPGPGIAGQSLDN